MTADPTFSLRELLDEYIADHRVTIDQIKSIAQTAEIAEAIGGPDLDTTALEWTLEANRLAKVDPERPGRKVLA